MLDVTGKLVARIVQIHLQQLVERELPEMQCNFRKGTKLHRYDFYGVAADQEIAKPEPSRNSHNVYPLFLAILFPCHHLLFLLYSFNFCVSDNEVHRIFS